MKFNDILNSLPQPNVSRAETMDELPINPSIGDTCVVGRTYRKDIPEGKLHEYVLRMYMYAGENGWVPMDTDVINQFNKGLFGEKAVLHMRVMAHAEVMKQWLKDNPDEKPTREMLWVKLRGKTHDADKKTGKVWIPRRCLAYTQIHVPLEYKYKYWYAVPLHGDGRTLIVGKNLGTGPSSTSAHHRYLDVPTLIERYIITLDNPITL